MYLSVRLSILFLPLNSREACEMAQNVVCCSDTLSELLVSIDLDIYISQTTHNFKAKNQVEETCYANAAAAVLHLAMQRILGREGGYPDFNELRDEMIKEYGNDPDITERILKKKCEKYRLQYSKTSVDEAKKAISEKRPVLAEFELTDEEWNVFGNFYEKNPAGILAHDELDVSKRPSVPPPLTSGHAVVLTSYNSKCLIFMNSWGQEWGDNGFFRVQNAQLLQLKFFDVYWTLDDLTGQEKEYYEHHGSEVAEKLVKSLKGLQKAEYRCPECHKSSRVTEYTGMLSKVCCPKCCMEFSTNDNAENTLALNIYLTALNR